MFIGCYFFVVFSFTRLVLMQVCLSVGTLIFNFVYDSVNRDGVAIVLEIQGQHVSRPNLTGHMQIGAVP